MKLNYYIAEKLFQVEVFVPCPGCGQTKNLAMHVKVISYAKNQRIFHIGCSCGWTGPECSTANLAIMKWDARVPIYT